jgi:hypothetical protein
MHIFFRFPFTEELIGFFSPAPAGDFDADRNHVCRMLNDRRAVIRPSPFHPLPLVHW